MASTVMAQLNLTERSNHVRTTISKSRGLYKLKHSFISQIPVHWSRASIGYPLKSGKRISETRSSAKSVVNLQTDSEVSNEVKITVLVPIQVKYGESVAVTGSSEWLGKWSTHSKLQWTEEGWKLDIVGEKGEEVELKFLILGGDQVWEKGENRKWILPSEGSDFKIVAEWNQTGETVNFLMEDAVASIRKAVKNEVHREQTRSKEEGRGERRSEKSKSPEDSKMTDFSKSWQGNDISFMSSNEHKRERRGAWDTTGLSGAALQIVEGDKKAGNWWRKLDVVQNVLQNSTPEGHLEALTYSAIYLQWINTGQIPCVEDGGHRRPNQHAGISRNIFAHLERPLASTRLDHEELVVLRALHPRLPSFTAEFTASVPLTRIRDIAHRNDIPSDLKNEIKHTIQNKLHRNAGPEDLVATEALLARVTKSRGDYSAGFVEQLEIFFQELKDFFNASSLTDQLEAIRPSLDAPGKSMLEAFYDSKKKVDSLRAPASPPASRHFSSETLIAALHCATGFRALLLQGLESGLRNDASEDAIAMRQKWRLCEIGLENYAFVLLSMYLNEVEAQGGASWLTQEAPASQRDRWSHPLGAVVLSLRQVALSGWQAQECLALEEELQVWQDRKRPVPGSPRYDSATREWALRLKASVDRARRLAEQYTEALLRLYALPSQTLGKALGIPEATVRTFAEAEIRASVVFQLAKLCSLLLRSLRQLAGSHGFDVIMPGTALGTLLKVANMDPSTLPPEAFRGAVVLLVDSADGDEEVQLPGCTLTGVILRQELPHLSHLGVRARQEGVVFVTCEDELQLVEIEAKLGQTVSLEASPDRVSVTKAKTLTPDPVALNPNTSFSDGGFAAREAASRVVLSPPGTVLQLAEAGVTTSGSKAATCGQLARLSEASFAGATGGDSDPPQSFLTPSGLVLPFGTLESAIAESGVSQDFHTLLEASETAQLEGGQLDDVCRQLRALLALQKLPEASLKALLSSRTFQEASSLIVRSSSNLEDLPGSSGAGLYDSIPGVSLADPGSFQEAVAKVWASLFSRRAVLSRRSSRVKQSQARMAVLVQELLSPAVSFVLHTRSPFSEDGDALHAELALGQGETLASGTRGTPYRLSVCKRTKEVTTLAFANFSEALVVPAGTSSPGGLGRRVARYGTARLSVDDSYREALGRRLAAVGQFLEEELGGPQDVEGCLVGEKLYVVQSRPQV